MRRMILLSTALLLLLVGALFLWHSTGCRLVGGRLCTNRTEQLDLSGQLLEDVDALTQLTSLRRLNLRDSGMTAAQYETLRAALPDCEILWSVPFQNTYYPDDTQHLSVCALNDSDLKLLAYFPRLESVDATRCTDADMVTALMDAYPELKVDFVVSLGGELISTDAETIALGSDSLPALERALTLLPRVREVDATLCPDYVGLYALQQRWPQVKIRYTVMMNGGLADCDATELTVTDPVLEQLERALGCLPNLKTLNLEGKLPESAQIYALQQKFPHIQFHWRFSLYGTTVRNTDETLNFSGMSIGSLEPLAAALPWFSDLKSVDLCNCGIPSAQIGALAEANPAVKFIWMVNIGSKIRIRTDATYLMPFQYGVTLTDADTGELKYCTDMLCLDLGHSMIRDISFLAHMPKLQYLTLGETQVSDISPLAGLQELVFLELFLTNVQDYSPLLSCPKLEDLNISYAIPKDMTVLCQLKQVKHMHLKGLWQDEWQQQLKAALPDTTFVFAGTGDVSSTGDGWRQLENYYKMRDLLGMPYMSY